MQSILQLYTGAMMRDLTVEQSNIPATTQIKCSPVNQLDLTEDDQPNMFSTFHYLVSDFHLL